METLLKLVNALPGMDWAALAIFFGGWVGYARFAKRRATTQPSVLASTNRVRHHWMLQTTRREARVIDAVVMQSLATSPSFFASTTILIIGGLLAALSTTEKASELVRDLPFTAQTSTLVFDLKLLLLLAIFVYCFFRFTWSMRQFNYLMIVMGAAPPQGSQGAMEDGRRIVARASRISDIATQHFNSGIRGYYFGLAALGWFVHPWLLIAASVFVLLVLWRREFYSATLAALRE